MTLYDELNIKSGATADQIKDNYRKLAKRLHPDVAGDDYDKEKWDRIRKAYIVLSDPERRKEYDQTGNDHSGPKVSLNDEAIQLLIMGIDAATTRVISKGEYDFDLVSMITSHINDSKKEANSHLEKSDKALKDLGLFKHKFRKTPGKTAILMEVVKDKISKMRDAKENIKRSLLVMDAALELLEKIEFDYTEEERVKVFLDIGSASASYRTFNTMRQGP